MEHFKASKQATSTSNFYMLYLSLESKRSNSQAARGNFEMLDQLVAAGFIPTSPSALTMDKDWREGGFNNQ